MKKTEQQQILEAIATLDQFAASTPLSRAWHAQWQMIYRQVEAKTHAIPIDTPDEPAGKQELPA